MESSSLKTSGETGSSFYFYGSIVDLRCRTSLCSAVRHVQTFFVYFLFHCGSSQDVCCGLPCYAGGPWRLSVLRSGLRLLTPPRVSLLCPLATMTLLSASISYIRSFVPYLLLSHKQERNNAICSSRDATREYLTKFSSLQSLSRVLLFATL